MQAPKALLAIFSALSMAALAGCLNNADDAAAAALPSETSALVALAGDSTQPAPTRRKACDILTARLDGLDSAAAQTSGLENAVGRVCADHPKAPKPRPVSPACSSLFAQIALVDSGSAAYDSLWALAMTQCFPQPPKPSPTCDSLLAQRARVDSGSAAYDSLTTLYEQQCSINPPRPPRSPRCDSLAAAINEADTLTPARDSAYARYIAECSMQPAPSKPSKPGKPAKPDSVRPHPSKPDSLRPVPPAKPDSGFTTPRDPAKPFPPKKRAGMTATAD